MGGDTQSRSHLSSAPDCDLCRGRELPACVEVFESGESLYCLRGRSAKGLALIDPLASSVLVQVDAEQESPVASGNDRAPSAWSHALHGASALPSRNGSTALAALDPDNGDEKWRWGS